MHAKKFYLPNFNATKILFLAYCAQNEARIELGNPGESQAEGREGRDIQLLGWGQKFRNSGKCQTNLGS